MRSAWIDCNSIFLMILLECTDSSFSSTRRCLVLSWNCKILSGQLMYFFGYYSITLSMTLFDILLILVETIFSRLAFGTWRVILRLRKLRSKILINVWKSNNLKRRRSCQGQVWISWWSVDKVTRNSWIKQMRIVRRWWWRGMVVKIMRFWILTDYPLFLPSKKTVAPILSF